MNFFYGSGNTFQKIKILKNILKNLVRNIKDKIFFKFSNILIGFSFLKKDIRIKLEENCDDNMTNSNEIVFFNVFLRGASQKKH